MDDPTVLKITDLNVTVEQLRKIMDELIVYPWTPSHVAILDPEKHKNDTIYTTE